MRLLTALFAALVAILLASGLAGSAQAHGGGHAPRAEAAGAVAEQAAEATQMACHCHAGAVCVQAIEAAAPLLLIHDRPMRAVTMRFEPRHERSQSLSADPPPPRA